MVAPVGLFVLHLVVSGDSDCNYVLCTLGILWVFISPNGHHPLLVGGNCLELQFLTGHLYTASSTVHISWHIDLHPIYTRVDTVRVTGQSPQGYPSLQFLQEVLSVLINKYKWCSPPRSPKRTEWGLLEVTTILNTTRHHSNLAEQCWYNQGIIVTKLLGTLMEASRRFTQKGKKLTAVTIRVGWH